MDSLYERLIGILHNRFPDVLVDGLEVIESTGRITGWIASTAFDELDDGERQDLLWGALEQDLSKQDLAHLGPIVALAPVETDFGLAHD
jgi:hypothetical protein